MKKPCTLLAVLTVHFMCSEAFECVDKSDENFVDFNGFTERDNSNVTYLTSNNGTVIEACEYVEENPECYESSYVVLKYYTKNSSTFEVSEFDDYLDCLNFLVHLEVKSNGLKIPIGKFLSMNNDLIETVKKVKNYTIEDPEIFCNNKTVPQIFLMNSKIYPESYKSKMIVVDGDILEFGPKVSIPFLHDPSVSYSGDDYMKKVFEDAFYSSWTRRTPTRLVKIPAGSGKMLSLREFKVKKSKEYTANFLIDSQSFEKFKRKLRSGELSLHQRNTGNGTYIDFEKDDSIVLRNLRIKEYVTYVTKSYSLSRAAPCEELLEKKKLLARRSK